MTVGQVGMARKPKHQKINPILEYRRLPLPELPKRYQACLDAGDYRAAIDIAKECYRREPAPANAERLGAAYVHRARGLMGKSLFTEAAAVLGHALALGQGNDELLRLAFECGLRSGQYGEAVRQLSRVRDPDQHTRALQMLIDEAVARGEGLARLCEPTIRDGVMCVRRALESFERGDDSAVAEHLKPIGLHSPLSDWKWLVRGLVAFAGEDSAAAENCWRRAGQKGRPGRLAQLLMAMLPGHQADIDALPAADRARLLACFDSPHVGKLERIREAIKAGRPLDALDHCTQLLALVPADQRPAYSRRIQRALTSELVWSRPVYQKFVRVFGPLPEDPRLIRCCAIDCEHEDPIEAQALWRLYLTQLHDATAIRPQLRDRARALVWVRLGELAAAATPPPEMLAYFPFPHGNDEDEVGCYRTSLKYNPLDLSVHERLLDALVRRKEWRAAEQHALQVLDRWPDHVRSLTLLAEQCFERDAYRKALGYFDRARRAEPLNPAIRRSMQTCLINSARRRINQQNWRLARADFEQAEALRESSDSPLDLYPAWVAMECLAGDEAQARAVHQRAISGAADALPVDFALAVELDRAGMAGPLRDEIEARLETGWVRPAGPATAAALAELSAAIDAQQLHSTHYEAHRSNVLAYLGRTPDESLAEAQLLSVCRFLDSVKHWALLARFAQRGTDTCAGNHYFPLYLGRSLQQRRKKLSEPTVEAIKRAGRQAMKAGDMRVAMELMALLEGHPIPFADRPLPIPDELLDMLDDLMDSVPGPRRKRRRAKQPRLPLLDQPDVAGAEAL